MYFFSFFRVFKCIDSYFFEFVVLTYFLLFISFHFKRQTPAPSPVCLLTSVTIQCKSTTTEMLQPLSLQSCPNECRAARAAQLPLPVLGIMTFLRSRGAILLRHRHNTVAHSGRVICDSTLSRHRHSSSYDTLFLGEYGRGPVLKTNIGFAFVRRLKGAAGPSILPIPSTLVTLVTQLGLPFTEGCEPQ